MVSDLCWPGGRRESDGLTRAAARVLTQPFLPAVDTEPACIDCSVFPARFNVGVVHVPGALYELTLEGAVIAMLAVVANVRALVVCVMETRVGDDGRDADDDPVQRPCSTSAPVDSSPSLQDDPFDLRSVALRLLGPSSPLLPSAAAALAEDRCRFPFAGITRRVEEAVAAELSSVRCRSSTPW